MAIENVQFHEFDKCRMGQWKPWTYYCIAWKIHQDHKFPTPKCSKRNWSIFVRHALVVLSVVRVGLYLLQSRHPAEHWRRPKKPPVDLTKKLRPLTTSRMGPQLFPCWSYFDPFTSVTGGQRWASLLEIKRMWPCRVDFQLPARQIHRPEAPRITVRLGSNRIGIREYSMTTCVRL